MAHYHKIGQGECLAVLALQYGFTDYHALWDDPKNAQLKSKRQNPNILAPGDILFIPDKKDKEESRGTSQAHSFQVGSAQVLLRIVLQDEQAQPLSNASFVLKIGDTLRSGTTSGNGLIEEPVPADSKEAELTLTPTSDASAEVRCWKLRLGFLDPFDTISGVQARLNNLGFYCGGVDGIFGPHTAAAVRAFEVKAGLPQTGKINPQTCASLDQVYGEAG